MHDPNDLKMIALLAQLLDEGARSGLNVTIARKAADGAQTYIDKAGYNEPVYCELWKEKSPLFKVFGVKQNIAGSPRLLTVIHADDTRLHFCAEPCIAHFYAGKHGMELVANSVLAVQERKS